MKKNERETTIPLKHVKVHLIDDSQFKIETMDKTYTLEVFYIITQDTTKSANEWVKSIEKQVKSLQ
jgi:hypothetical protein